MADEKKIKNEEITDEQANDASGGFFVPASVLTLPCATPGCKGKVPVNANRIYCDKCLEDQAGN